MAMEMLTGSCETYESVVSTVAIFAVHRQEMKQECKLASPALATVRWPEGGNKQGFAEVTAPIGGKLKTLFFTLPLVEKTACALSATG